MISKKMNNDRTEKIFEETLIWNYNQKKLANYHQKLIEKKKRVLPKKGFLPTKFYNSISKAKPNSWKNIINFHKKYYFVLQELKEISV